ncbi:MAG TPA: hypothetical protein VMG99_03400, partial [Thermoplasmata archaeon]|nr:hypothetical protein [Thermoplasmata archaeon]
YNPHSHQWSLNWASRRVGTVDPPMVGEFRDGIGAFYGSEAVDGRVVLARNRFLEIAPDSSCFEPAYSADGGETWETNWVMRFTRTDVPRVAPERAERNRDGERGDGSAR